jgi:undecaprenyl diphosphate synthase
MYKNLLRQIDPTRLPQHVAIIMDGNGRWARERHLPRVFGHRVGISSVKAAVKMCLELGIKYLTLYAFSTENWARPESEIKALFRLLEEFLHKERKKLMKEGIKLNVIGRWRELPDKVVKSISSVLEETKNNEKLVLNIALNYGGRQEIIDAVNKGIKNGEKDFSIETLQKYLYTNGMPEPDLLIRTSGEYRISNFLLWQIAYTELYFTEIYWPEFREEEFLKAIIDYQKRERRFGKI